MPQKLQPEEIVTMERMHKRGMKKSAIAQALEVTEGTVRHHLKRRAAKKQDGRKEKVQQASQVAQIIAHWVKETGAERPANIRDLHEHLVSEHDYSGAYKGVLRFVRRHYGKPAIRTYRRIETPAGMMVQTDWAEFPAVMIGGELTRLSALVMVLAHSRKVVVIWKKRKDQCSWQEAHLEAFHRLGGVPQLNRIDNVKTAMVTAGPWGKVNPVYETFARQLGFAIDACQPHQPYAKGKVEAKVRLARLRVNPEGKDFASLQELQQWTDQRLTRWADTARCPATGTSVTQAWEKERAVLVLPLAMPTPFEVVVTRQVHKDCSVNFEGRIYSVPFTLVGKLVEIHGCAETVEVYAEGRRQIVHPRYTAERIVIDEACYEGKETKTHIPPQPLSASFKIMLQQAKESRPHLRDIEEYARLVEAIA